ncbi:MAG: RIP metalloprotease RseP [Prevotellaceae bacterium]|jgi:regulator of sigma E protease|nr:RIP metalloprotease RseP [Prevotellaceae bacterium]
MEIFLIKAAQLMAALAVLVFIHELGHFLFSRMFGVRVDKFYLFFNPQISIVRFKKINGKWKFKFFAKNLQTEVPVLDENGKQKTDKKGKKMTEPIDISTLEADDWRRFPEKTEWGIGWLPVGGYCKIAGMVDESKDENAKRVSQESWAYESHPVWQRILISAGGVIFNFVSAILIFAMMLFHYGEQTIPLESEYLGYNYCETAQNYGFVNGDRVLSIDDEAVFEKFDVAQKIIIEGRQKVVLLRDTEEVTLNLPKDFSEKIIAAKEKIFMTERVPFVVDSVMQKSPASDAGLQKGDSIVGINSKHLFDYQDITKELADCKTKKVGIDFYRNGELISDSITINEEGKIGVGLKNYLSFFKLKTVKYGFFASFPAGWRHGVETLVNYVKQFRLVFTKAGAQSLGGFGTIGSLFPAQWDWATFWSMTAFLSVILAFMNILPLPILDGGYILFLLYEGITRKKPSEKFMDVALNIGLWLLVALMIFANGNDILRAFGLN